jgi:hypothetical protein
VANVDQNGSVLVAVAAVTAVAAAVRSTWSPCGLSMLSSITPISERAKGHRYYATCAWFVAGAVLGGASLGAVSALVAVGVDAGGLSGDLARSLGAVVLLVAALSDAPRSFTLPFHRRQVNEDWLDQYRPWLYASGFGWQIGCGVATYVMTAGVYALVVLGGLGGNVGAAVALGALFGLVRGLAVLVSRRVHTPAELLQLHARFERATVPVRDAVVAAYAGGAAALVLGARPVVAIPVGFVVAVALALGPRMRRHATTPAPA